MSEDLFKDVPEFLTAFSEITAKGFFDSLEFRVNLFEGKLMNCKIAASGFVPNDPKYLIPSCDALVDPQDILEKIREYVHSGKLQSIVVEVKSSNWILYENDKNIGSKGVEKQLSFFVAFGLD